MKIAVFSTKPYDERFLTAANAKLESPHALHFLEARLNADAAPLAAGHKAVCAFVNDQLNRPTLEALAAGGIKLIALRCAGFNQVDLHAARELGFTILRVPAYSPYSVAEHTVGLILALNRRLHRAYNRVREGNFALDGLLGFDLHGSTVGIVGTGKIGAVTAGIMQGFGCKVLAFDVHQNPECVQRGMAYVPLDELFKQSDIISLHCPLTPQTQHLINARSLAMMKKGVMVINTSRGGLLDTHAVIHALKSGKIGYLGLDVYEQEADLFFEDLSNTIIQDDVFQRLQTFPNVLITGHQAFFTTQALENIARTTLENISCYERGEASPNAVPLDKLR